MIKIEELEELSRELRAFEKAIASLDGELGSVNLDPNDAGSIEQAIIEYLVTPPDRATLVRLIADAGLTPRQAAREKGTPFEELGLGHSGGTDDQILDAMLPPILINRPIMVTERGTRLRRPSEVVPEISPPLSAPFIKEDGDVIAPAG